MRSAWSTVESRWAIRMVITWLEATSRMVSVISSSVSESSDEVASSKTSRCGRRSRARAMDRRCFSPPETLTPALADHRVEAAVGARQQAVAGGLLQHLQALGVGGVGLHEQQVLADRAREELRVLGHEADLLAQLVEVDGPCPASPL